MDDEYGDIQDFQDILATSEAIDKAASGPSRQQQPEPEPKAKIQQPKPQALPARRGPSSILVSSRQKGNPILHHIRLTPWEYADIPADYLVGTTSCALFLSLKYHRLHPEYIYTRIKALGGKFRLRILLTMVDIPNHEDSLKELSKTCLINNLTIILCWSAPEVAHYLELFKSSEHAQPTAIRSRQAQSYKDSLVEFVTAPRSINKSDAASLMSTFGSLRDAINAQPEQISAVPGWGERKVKQWTSAVQEDFRTDKAPRSAPGEPQRQRQPQPQPGQSDTRQHSTVEEGDEAAMEAMREAERSQLAASTRPGEASEGLSDGILAALSKYRNE
ncbi:mating-type switching protein swi10 [Nannizzia gypsea CBS 118893]|uniref:Mating-type switching protein swi10 n=1 Tax=Arthroderma gypseum (strain ATCC MYA-4604 / CBS 118893) TaxID=535722 RepID=E5R409_ARTGP|nr:mating-type switching protein swi10 [Nannizzia gypsea CBS 118893]EFQ98855.1 mating-type switching protein swi10 [Nannizzia gypsea CBS 118893]